jgi:2-polyprenyl-3-methyl-5-hydroxy-6-metoxy-1,4-benzoquinol methylase
MQSQTDTYHSIVDNLNGRAPSVSEYKKLSGLCVTYNNVHLIRELDPFSDAYKDEVVRIYLDLRGNQDEAYEALRDESAPMGLPQNIFSDVVPWHFKRPEMISEFLYSWGHIFELLDLPDDRTSTVLEYGAGTGQILLMLARLGVEAFGVDINPDAIALIRAQADAMGLQIHTEQANFGEGFEGKTFDRIIFYEAFHHAIDFMPLLHRLRQRLNPDGRLILCGEPIVEHETASIPYKWGPRLDGLSAFCIKRYGWMELGFTRDFIFEAMDRTGWHIQAHPFPSCGRADAYVAVPKMLLLPGQKWFLAVGTQQAEAYLNGADWFNAEGSHRWTRHDVAVVKLPDYAGLSGDIVVSVGNLLPIEKKLKVSCGDISSIVLLPPNTENKQIELVGCQATTISIETMLHRISEVISGSSDDRQVGIIVKELSLVAS